ncbi:MAG: Holliday junction resolvase-like protein [Methanobacteriota archaeon]
MLETIVILILIIVLIWILIRYIRLTIKVEERARTLHEKWRDRDLIAINRRLKEEADDTIQREVGFRNREWQTREENRIRQDAIKRSREVIHGKVTEHLIPFFPSFPWNPSDARFLGSPIDFVVFDGLSEGMVREIILVEVKSGASRSLTQRERSVQQCAHKGAVSFRTIHPDDIEKQRC